MSMWTLGCWNMAGVGSGGLWGVRGIHSAGRNTGVSVDIMAVRAPCNQKSWVSRRKWVYPMRGRCLGIRNTPKASRTGSSWRM